MRKLYRIHATWSSGCLKGERDATTKVDVGSEIEKRKTGKKEGRSMKSKGGEGRGGFDSPGQ